MLFNGRHCNTSAEINNEWANYFAELYTPTQAAHFDDTFSESKQTEMVNIRRHLENSSESATYPVRSVEEVESALKLAQRNKAGGDDGLMYEHFVYGGPLLCDVLSRFFNAVVKLSYAPKDMKRGVIITLKFGRRERIIRTTIGLSRSHLFF